MTMILSIKKKWYDMILSGEKKEEYREIKPYYETRLPKLFKEDGRAVITLRNGYGKACPSRDVLCELEIGEGKTEWGAESGKEYYILKILMIY